MFTGKWQACDLFINVCVNCLCLPESHFKVSAFIKYSITYSYSCDNLLIILYYSRARAGVILDVCHCVRHSDSLLTHVCNVPACVRHSDSLLTHVCNVPACVRHSDSLSPHVCNVPAEVCCTTSNWHALFLMI